MGRLTLHIDSERWRHHITHYVARHQGDLVPVIKGNGYGFGIPTLAREAANFHAQTVACYSVEEATVIRSQFDSDVLLLNPDEALSENWVIHTIAPISAPASTLQPKRFVIEVLSPVKRHGFATLALKNVLEQYSAFGSCEGLAIHLPIQQKGSMARWVTQLLDSLLKEGIEPSRYRNTLWISHLSNDDLLQLKKAHPDLRWKVRVGTDLWLGARTSLTATAEVMDRHQISAGERVGYRQSAPGKGWLLVASGGTSQGIGLEVPKSGFKSLVKVILELLGWSPSPYSWNGRALSLVEPPHMHNTLLFIKKGVPPEIGEEIGLNVRFTTTTFDEIVFE